MRSSLRASPRSLSVLFILTSLAGSSTAPWQTQSKNAVEESMYTNMPPTIFSSNGRLYSVERMVDAASSADDVSSNVVAAIACDEGIVVVSCRTQSPHLDDDNCTETTSLLIPLSMHCQVGPQVYATTGGNAADSQILKDKILQISSILWERCNSGLGVTLPLPPSLLARHVADHLQRPTQQISSGKILASQALVWDACSLWRVDTSGQFWKCRAAAIGRSHHIVEAALVKTWNASLTIDEAIQCAVEAVQTVVNQERRLFGMIVKKGTFATLPLTHEMLSRKEWFQKS